jgi:hypothetical protein
LGLLAFTSLVLPPGVASALAFMFFVFPFAWWAGSGKPWPRELVVAIVPFVVMIVAGLVHAFSHSKFEIGKDVWYLGNGALMLGAAFALVKISGARFETIARPVIIVGLLTAMLHLVRFAIHPSILLKPAAAIRLYAGFGSGLAGNALVMIIVCVWLRLRVFGALSWMVYPIGLVCAASLALSFSRTGWLVVVAQLVVLSGVISVASPKRVLLYGLAMFVALIAVVTIPVPISHGAGQEKFIDKLKRSFEEIRVDEYFLRDRIQANWRGYETARALRTYKEGAPDEWVLGRGLGTNVDLGLGLVLGGGPRADLTRYAPILHNGYLFILVKSGIVGLAALIFWFAYIAVVGARAAGSTTKTISLSGRLIVATIFLMALTNWTTSSVFPKGGATGFLVLGALMAIVTRTASSARRDVEVEGEKRDRLAYLS